jgi:hypothetical protein
MRKYDYLLSQKDSNLVFGIISQVSGLASEKNTELTNKVIQAVKDEYCYEICEVLDISETNSTIFIEIQATNDCDEEEIREFELNLTTIY